MREVAPGSQLILGQPASDMDILDSLQESTIDEDNNVVGRDSPIPEQKVIYKCAMAYSTSSSNEPVLRKLCP